MKRSKRLLAPLWPIGIGMAAVLATSCASAQELSLYAGPLTGGSGNRSYSWAIDYTEGFGQYFAGSIGWLNEGHVPGHHRDGQAVQVWARLPSPTRRFVFSVGVGPYRYFDTETAANGGGYSNTHGWGVVYSARAAFYSAHRWTANLQLNHVQVSSGPSTTALLVGIGYQLDAPGERGPRAFALPRTRKVTNNEISLLAGETILNNNGSATSIAEAIEFRHGLTRYLDGTIGYLHEGNAVQSRRDGITAQLWLTRAFFDERLALGIGAGAYAAVHRPDGAQGGIAGDGIFSGLVSITASYRLTPHWSARLTWNRVVTRYSRDTDVILGGIGYRF